MVISPVQFCPCCEKDLRKDYFHYYDENNMRDIEYSTRYCEPCIVKKLKCHLFKEEGL